MPTRSAITDAPLVVRRGASDDAAALRTLGEAVVAATYAPIDPAYADFTLATWWDETAMRRSLVDLWHGVAEQGERLVGVANLGQAEERWVMWKLYVHPNHHGLGIGSRLLQATLDQLPAGAPLWLEYVDGNTRAAAFYERHGFVEHHREPTERFPDLVWMRREP